MASCHIHSHFGPSQHLQTSPATPCYAHIKTIKLMRPDIDHGSQQWKVCCLHRWKHLQEAYAAFAAMMGRRLSGSISWEHSSMMRTSKVCSASTGSLAELQVTPTIGMLFSSFLRRRSAPCSAQCHCVSTCRGCIKCNSDLEIVIGLVVGITGPGLIWPLINKLAIHQLAAAQYQSGPSLCMLQGFKSGIHCMSDAVQPCLETGPTRFELYTIY